MSEGNVYVLINEAMPGPNRTAAAIRENMQNTVLSLPKIIAFSL
jgi:hypothetical protein